MFLQTSKLFQHGTLDETVPVLCFRTSSHVEYTQDICLIKLVIVTQVWHTRVFELYSCYISMYKFVLWCHRALLHSKTSDWDEKSCKLSSVHHLLNPKVLLQKRVLIWIHSVSLLQLPSPWPQMHQIPGRELGRNCCWESGVFQLGPVLVSCRRLGCTETCWWQSKPRQPW